MYEFENYNCKKRSSNATPVACLDWIPNSVLMDVNIWTPESRRNKNVATKPKI